MKGTALQIYADTASNQGLTHHLPLPSHTLPVSPPSLCVPLFCLFFSSGGCQAHARDMPSISLATWCSPQRSPRVPRSGVPRDLFNKAPSKEEDSPNRKRVLFDLWRVAFILPR